MADALSSHSRASLSLSFCPQRGRRSARTMGSLACTRCASAREARFGPNCGQRGVALDRVYGAFGRYAMCTGATECTPCPDHSSPTGDVSSCACDRGYVPPALPRFGQRGVALDRVAVNGEVWPYVLFAARLGGCSGTIRSFRPATCRARRECSMTPLAPATPRVGRRCAST